jgi:DNA relaxase NicK
MEYSEIITRAYSLIKSALTERFGNLGYTLIEEKNNDAVYESKFTIWSDNKDALRLTWDGSENVFLIEISNTFPVSASAKWLCISRTEFNPAYSSAEYIHSTARNVISGLFKR